MPLDKGVLRSLSVSVSVWDDNYAPCTCHGNRGRTLLIQSVWLVEQQCSKFTCTCSCVGSRLFVLAEAT